MNAGGAKARSLLYMEAMKSKTRESSISFRGEDDPSGLPDAAEPPPSDGATAVAANFLGAITGGLKRAGGAAPAAGATAPE